MIKFVIVLLVSMAAAPISAQNNVNSATDATTSRARQSGDPKFDNLAPLPPDTPRTAGSGAALTHAFRKIALGDSLENVEQALKDDSLFYFPGSFDVTMMDPVDRTFVETTGTTYIKRAYFSFKDDKLYAITLEIKPDNLDYAALFAAIRAKYGDPKDINPDLAYWDDGAVRLSVERPLVVKYVESGTLNQIIKSSETLSSARDMSRQDFLNNF